MDGIFLTDDTSRENAYGVETFILGGQLVFQDAIPPTVEETMAAVVAAINAEHAAGVTCEELDGEVVSTAKHVGPVLSHFAYAALPVRGPVIGQTFAMGEPRDRPREYRCYLIVGVDSRGYECERFV